MAMGNNTRVVVQLMPLIMIVCSVLFYALGAHIHSVFCLILGIVMWMACFPDKK